jgi:hypothetical protein
MTGAAIPIAQVTEPSRLLSVCHFIEFRRRSPPLHMHIALGRSYPIPAVGLEESVYWSLIV